MYFWKNSRKRVDFRARSALSFPHVPTLADSKAQLEISSACFIAIADLSRE